MASLKDVCEEDKLYTCDNCGHTFKAKEVALEDATTNIKVFTPMKPPVLIDENGTIKGGSMEAEEGDRALACPKCKTVHPFGFSLTGGKDVNV